MRSKSEFLARMSEYGWLKYEQSVTRIVSGPATLEDQAWNNPSSVVVWKFVKGHSDITVVYDTSSDIHVDFIVTLIGGCHEHRKEVSQIAMGADLDEVEKDKTEECNGTLGQVMAFLDKFLEEGIDAV